MKAAKKGKRVCPACSEKKREPGRIPGKGRRAGKGTEEGVPPSIRKERALMVA